MNPEELAERIREVAVMPILIPHSADACLAIAEALVEGGARGIEIVLRTPEALPTVERLRRTFPELVVGAGTILTPALYDSAAAAGAHFGISPGSLPALLEHARGGALPLVPGVQTPSEVMAAQAAGFNLLKFYPAEPAGGTDVLGDYGNVFPTARFMPSGKIDLPALPRYAALFNIASVGGTWMYAEGGATLAAREIVARMRVSLQVMRDGRR